MTDDRACGQRLLEDDASADEGVIATTDEVVALPPAARGLRHALRAFRHRDFRIFWTGALFSNTGTWLQNLAVPYVIYTITDRALWVGIATFCQFVPGMIFGPIGGSIADSRDRRRTLLTTQTLMAGAALTLWVLWVSGVRNVWAILAVVAVAGSLNGLNIPSWQSFVNDMVPRQDLLSAVTLNSVQFNAARAIGPGIAGLLLATLGPSWAFLINACSFLFVLGALALVHTRPRVVTGGEDEDGEGVLARFATAIRYSAAHPGIANGILIAILIGALCNPVFQFTVVFADQVFGVGPLGLGAMNVCLGIGAVGIAPIISGWDAVLSRGALVKWGLIGCGIGMVVFAAAPGFAGSLVALVAVGASFLAVISASNTAVQYQVADHIRGRVVALRVMVFTGSYPLGALIMGWLSDRIGPQPTMAGAGGLLVAAAVALGFRRGFFSSLDAAHDPG